ncbi:MAG: DNA-directed RNA polymerase subunit alpha [Candidatus Neomarinimicrobiota bacterium]|nr:DNA-directed RNA polymerase subunit alpha [Candidatus Neomarinimicrobiota bacterium]|tara:strand:+ start:56 stop:1030 length:975 start_codon:yes stop_codon:yes gene_type:complete
MAKKVLELNVDFKEESKSGDNGSFSLQPLERGYGTTIGNAMRRVLMTSIPGAAITHVKIEGVQHEFSTIDGVKDDVADIIMNLKKIRFKLMDNEPDKVTLSLKGKKSFTAKDIQDASNQFTVLNPDEYITEINSKGKLDIEVRIGIGKGYVPSEENDKPNLPVGTLSIDSIFNPVTNVTFNVQPVPGAKEPIEILTLDVTTDSSITAKDAISYSATYLREHFKFIEAISNPSVLEISDGVSDETMALRKLLNQTIDEMELSVRSYNCLQAAGIKFIHELVSKEENQMLKYKNFGRKSLTELVEKLDSMGLHFGMAVEKIMAEEG